MYLRKILRTIAKQHRGVNKPHGYSSVFLGNSFDAHTYFGAHVTEEGVVFRTLAPNAAAVDLIWEGGEWEPMPMKRYMTAVSMS